MPKEPRSRLAGWLWLLFVLLGLLAFPAAICVPIWASEESEPPPSRPAYCTYTLTQVAAWGATVDDLAKCWEVE